VIVFRVKKWLEEDEFKELTRIADYMGFENGVKSFRLNLDKAFRNGYTLVDIKNLICEYSIDCREVEVKLEEVASNYTPVFEWISSKGVVKLSIPRSIYGVVKEDLKKYSPRFIGLVEDKVVLEILPYKAPDVYKTLRDKLGNVLDPQNLFTEKPLVIQPELRNIELRPYQKESA